VPLKQTYKRKIERTRSFGSIAERVKKRFYGDRVITIAWSRFNSYSHRTRCCALG